MVEIVWLCREVGITGYEDSLKGPFCAAAIGSVYCPFQIGALLRERFGHKLFPRIFILGLNLRTNHFRNIDNNYF